MDQNQQPKNCNTDEPIRAIPVTATGRYDNIPAVIVDNTTITLKMKETYSLSKRIKCLALIDVVFSFMYAFYNVWFFIPLFFAYFGYFGAQKFKANYIMAYMIYNILVILFRIVSTVLFIVSYYNGLEISPSTYTLNLLFSFLSIIVEIWIIKIVKRFHKNLIDLTIPELNKLKQGLQIEYRVIYY